MTIRFTKMVAAGNDMILVDHRNQALAGRESEAARSACARHDGIGADGLILLEQDPEVDFRVRFFNPDGTEYRLCGNGARCIPYFAESVGLGPGPFRFRTGSGLHTARTVEAGVAAVTVPGIRELRTDIPVQLDGHACRVDWGDIGVPHAVLWMDRPVVEVPLLLWGPQLRGAPAFAPEGTNISFARKIARDTLEIRTYERGVEAETTCGSGSCVVAMLARRRGWVGEEVTLIVSGGEALIVQLPAAPGGELVLTGPAVAVHEGSFGFPPRNLKG